MIPKESKAKAIAAAARCLKAKGYISMVDVLTDMGKLTREDHERWRLRQVPYLEKVARGTLTQLDIIVRAVRAHSLNGGLKPSRTVYTSWGKGRRQPLRFTKTGNRFLEDAYSTHYLPQRGSSLIPEGTGDDSDHPGTTPRQQP